MKLEKGFHPVAFTVEILRRRANRVLVVLGPLNEHMLAQQSLPHYIRRKQQVESWLRQQKIACCVPQVLPSEDYADASHPLPDGYARLAAEIFRDPSFRQFSATAPPPGPR